MWLVNSVTRIQFWSHPSPNKAFILWDFLHLQKSKSVIKRNVWYGFKSFIFLLHILKDQERQFQKLIFSPQNIVDGTEKKSFVPTDRNIFFLLIFQSGSNRIESNCLPVFVSLFYIENQLVKKWDEMLTQRGAWGPFITWKIFSKKKSCKDSIGFYEQTEESGF